MLRHVLSSIIEVTSGSMRKRLYVRLAAGVVVLATTIAAIAVAQRATAPRQTASETPPAGVPKPPARKPQPFTPSGSEQRALQDDQPGDDGEVPQEPRNESSQYVNDDGSSISEDGYEEDGSAEEAYSQPNSAPPSQDPYSRPATRIAPPGGNSRYGSHSLSDNTSGPYAGEGADSGNPRYSENVPSDEPIYGAEARPVAAESTAPTEENAEESEGGDDEEIADAEPIDESNGGEVPGDEPETGELAEAELAPDDSDDAEGQIAAEPPTEIVEDELAETETAVDPGAPPSRPPAALSGGAGTGARISLADQAPGGPVDGNSPGAGQRGAPPARLSTPPASAQPLPPGQLPAGLRAAPGLAGNAPPPANLPNTLPNSAASGLPNTNDGMTPLGGVPPRTLAPTRAGVSNSTGLGSAAIPRREAAAGSVEGTAATPGHAALAGMQAPAITIEKVVPAEVQVGRPATFELRLRNVGQVTAQDVIVMDRVPEGTDLAGTVPEAQLAGDVLLWRLAAIPPGGEATVTMEVTPHREGAIGSVAQVTFSAQATAQTVSTQPKVILEVAAAPQVMIGDSLVLAIVLRNDGTGAAQNLFLEADVPEGLTHPAGRELENEIGTLRPGESRPLNLTLKADRAGRVRGQVRVRDDANLSLLKEVDVEVVAPHLDVQVAGPTLRYLQRQAVYQLNIANTGTAAARRVELIAKLPTGMKFVAADKLGQYDASRHEVYWNIDELPSQQTGTVSLTTLPIEPGEGILRVEGFAELAEPRAMDHPVRVAAVSELVFSVSDTADPIEVGSDTVYEIEITNRGGKADTNVIIAAQLPEELEAVNAEGPTQGTAQGQFVEFEPVPQLGPGQQLLFRITAKGRTMSDARIVIQVRSDDTPKPISKEESTRIYSD